MKPLHFTIGISLFAFSLGCQRDPATYAADCPTRAPGWGGPTEGIGHLRYVQPVSVDRAGSIEWAGKPISDGTLRHFMEEVSKLNPQPQVVLEVAPNAPCQRVQVIRQAMSEAPVCKRERLCSEGNDWKKWRIVGGP